LYTKITPLKLPVVVALANWIPEELGVTPLGSGALDTSSEKVPPRTTPCGSVCDRSKPAELPAIRTGAGSTLQEIVGALSVVAAAICDGEDTYPAASTAATLYEYDDPAASPLSV